MNYILNNVGYFNFENNLIMQVVKDGKVYKKNYRLDYVNKKMIPTTEREVMNSIVQWNVIDNYLHMFGNNESNIANYNGSDVPITYFEEYVIEGQIK